LLANYRAGDDATNNLAGFELLRSRDPDHGLGYLAGIAGGSVTMDYAPGASYSMRHW